MINIRGLPLNYSEYSKYILITRFEKDKIIEEWVASDLAFQLMLKQ
jgi:hypothetical protein